MLLGGLALLLAGANALVRGASHLAKALGISPLVVGLTIVAFGTSSPELAIATSAAMSGNGALAIGNVVGSNIANVLLILGLAAVIAPLIVTKRLIRLDVPFMIVLSLLMYAMASDGSIARWEGITLFVIAIVYTTFLIRHSRRQPQQEEVPVEKTGPIRTWRDVLLILAGLAMLILGSKLLVTGAMNIAHALNVDELIIGLTVIAIGTSAPEIATTVTAAIKGQREMAIGGVIGSNIFNILLVLGVASSIAPNPIPVPASALAFDIPVMIVVAVACVPIFFTGFKIMRWEGVLFLCYYIAYTLYLVLLTQHHEKLPMFSHVLSWYAIPLTAITLSVLCVHAWRKYRAHGHPKH
ncbi:MAG: calcium/sodium antiporter [Armatimonadetes bacterium]|nr:calcium/sodium antiporter [Armatimonadota bacterium]